MRLLPEILNHNRNPNRNLKALGLEILEILNLGSESRIAERHATPTSPASCPLPPVP